MEPLTHTEFERLCVIVERWTGRPWDGSDAQLWACHELQKVGAELQRIADDIDNPGPSRNW